MQNKGVYTKMENYLIDLGVTDFEKVWRLMESNMVKSFSGSNISLVISYFKDNLPHYRVIAETSHKPNWAVRLAKDNIEINVSGDIGFSIEIFIDKTKYELWQYDRSVNEAMKTNERNILYQLNVLKNFLTETAV